MSLDPLQIPMLYGKVAIAATALTHALFATFIVGSSLIGVSTETIGWVTRKARYERLAHTIGFILILTTAAVSFLGVILIFLLNIFWPRFWSTLFRIMFWPLLLEAIFFLGEAIFAYAWYYSWEWARPREETCSGAFGDGRVIRTPGVGGCNRQWGEEGWRKRVHLLFGWLAAGFALAAMMMIDMVASYMLTPRPPELLWDRLFNPTMIHLHLHRWFGNLTWTGFGLSAICAIAFLRARDHEDQRHYRWAGGYCFAIGFGALLVMPVIGYQYLLRIRYEQPQAFQTLMLGGRSWLFDLVALLYGMLIVLGSIYIWKMVRSAAAQPPSFRTFMPVSVAIVVLAAVMFALPYHLQHVPFASWLTSREILPLGKMQPNKYFAIAGLVIFGVMNWVYFLRSFVGGTRAPLDSPVVTQLDRPDRWTPKLLILLAVCSIAIYLTMGWVRETARAWNGYLIYGEISFEDEQPTYDAPR